MFRRKVQVRTYDNTTLHLSWNFFLFNKFKTICKIYKLYSLSICELTLLIKFIIYSRHQTGYLSSKPTSENILFKSYNAG